MRTTKKNTPQPKKQKYDDDDDDFDNHKAVTNSNFSINFINIIIYLSFNKLLSNPTSYYTTLFV